MTTKEDIERNLDNVANGKPLDVPLVVLNGVFKKKYKEETDYVYETSRKGHRKEYNKKYYQKHKKEAKT